MEVRYLRDKPSSPIRGENKSQVQKRLTPGAQANHAALGFRRGGPKTTTWYGSDGRSGGQVGPWDPKDSHCWNCGEPRHLWEACTHGSRVVMCSVCRDDKSTQDWIKEEYDQCGSCIWLRLATSATSDNGIVKSYVETHVLENDESRI